MGVSSGCIHQVYPVGVSSGCVHQVCPVGVFIRCVQWVCSSGVSSGCVHQVCPVGVFIRCVQWVCSSGVSSGCVHQVCPVGVFIRCVSLSLLGPQPQLSLPWRAFHPSHRWVCVVGAQRCAGLCSRRLQVDRCEFQGIERGPELWVRG